MSAPERLPRVSIVITSYNQRALLADTIRSALDQTVGAHEVIVVDDASSDGTIAMLDRLDRLEPSLRAIRQPVNVGISANRNTGLAAVTGEMVVFVDGDDLLDSTYVEVMAHAAASAPRAAIYANYRRVDVGTDECRTRWPGPLPTGDVFVDFARGRSGVGRTMLAPVEAVRQVGGLDPRFPKHDGLVLSVRLAADLAFVAVDQCVMTKRDHDAGDSRSFSETERLAYLRAVAAEVRELAEHRARPEREQIAASWRRRLARVEARAQVEA